jgi:hypothetical protein
MNYSLIFNALGYGYIHTDYIFININNINTWINIFYKN